MSDVPLGTATGYLELDASDLNRGASAAEVRLNRLTDVVRDNWWGLRNLGLAFAGFSTGVAVAFGMAVSSATKWETAMAGVERTTYDGTQSAEENAAALGEIDRQLRSIASIKPIDSISIAGIAEEAGALGLAREDVAAFTSVVADLAATTDLTEQEATTSLARIAGLLGVPASGFQNLASAILETGRSTQSTEPEIVKMATRLTGIASTVGLTADQLIGLSASVASLGIRAEMGSSAIQRTFLQMIDAVSEGGDSLEKFASISGMTSEQFTQTFQQDAGGALTAFVQGLADVQASGGDVTATLKSMELGDIRVIGTLLRLAAAQGQNVNENLKLTSAMEISNKAFNEGSALQEIAARRYATADAQIQLLKNHLVELARSYGSLFLPLLKLAVVAVDGFVQGLNQMPEPLRIITAILTAMVAAMSAVAAGFLLLGPRILLVRQSLMELAATAEGSAAHVAEAQAKEVAAVEAATAAEIKAYSARAAASKAAAAADAASARATTARAKADRLAAVVAANGGMTVVEAKAAETVARETAAAAALAAGAAEIEMEETLAVARLRTSAPGWEPEVIAARKTLEAATHKLAVAEAELAVAHERTVVLSAAGAKNADALAAAELRAAEAATAASLARDRAAASYGKAGASAAAAAAAEREAAAAAAASTTASTASAGALSKLASAGSKFGKSLGWIGVALTVLTIGTAVFGAAQKDAKDPAEDLVDVNQELVEVLRDEANGVKSATAAWVENQLMMSNALSTAKRLGISVKDINDIVSGQASKATADNFLTATTEAAEAGDKSAQRLQDQVLALYQDYKDAYEVVKLSTAARNELGVANDGLADSEEDLGDSVAGTTEEIEKRNQATLDYIDSIFGQRRAALDLADAEEAYATALSNSKNPAAALEAAERKLLRARDNQTKSLRDIRKAEKAVARARSEALGELADAEDRLADARDSYVDGLRKISDLEEELAELRAGGPLQDLIDKTNELRDAQLRLARAEDAVQDAEWQLNYLRSEGAGAEDIEDAEMALAEAKAEQQNATADTIKTEEELADLRDGASTEEIADAERELEAARRDSESALRDISDLEQDLADKREDVASDTAYKEAQAELNDAYISYADNVAEAGEAERELQRIRSNSKTKELETAELDLEEAIIGVADANVEAKKRVAEMNGEVVTAADEAKWTADELEKLLDDVPEGKTKDNIQKVIDILRKVKPAKEDAAGGKDPLALPKSPKEYGKEYEKAGEEAGKGFWTKLKEKLGGDAGTGATIGGTLGAIGGSVIPGVGTLIGGLAGAAYGAILGVLWGKFLPGILSFFGGIGEKIVNVLDGAWDAVYEFFSKIPGKIMEELKELPEKIERFFRAIPRNAGRALGLGIGTIGKAISTFAPSILKFFAEQAKLVLLGLPMAWIAVQNWFGALPGKIVGWIQEHDQDIIRWFEDLPGNVVEGADQAWDAVWEFFRSLPQKIGVFLTEGLPELLNWFKELPGKIAMALFGIATTAGVIALDFIGGFIGGLEDSWPEAAAWVKGIPEKISEAAGAAEDWLNAIKDRGRELLTGLLNGANEKFTEVKEWARTLGLRILASVGTAVEWGEALLEHGKAIIAGLWNGMKETWRQVKEWVEGLIDWIRENKGPESVDKTALVDNGKAIIQGLWDGMKERWKDVQSWMAGLIGGVVDAAGNVVDAAGNALIGPAGQILKGAGGLLGNLFGDDPGGMGSFVDGAVSDVERIKRALGNMSPDALSAYSALDVAKKAQMDPRLMASFGAGTDPFAPSAPLPPPATVVVKSGDVIYEGDNVEVNAAEMRTPEAIVDEYTWSRRTRVRSRG